MQVVLRRPISLSLSGVSTSRMGARLRSEVKSDLKVQKSKICFGDCAISVAGPRCWNNIPTSIRSASTQFLVLILFHFSGKWLHSVSHVFEIMQYNTKQYPGLVQVQTPVTLFREGVSLTCVVVLVKAPS